MSPSLPELLPIRPFTRPANAAVRVPGSKSITNRALALGALCRNGVKIAGGLESRDTEIMKAALGVLGRRVENAKGCVCADGAPESGFFPHHAPLVKLHVGNAGTAARFLTALLALQPDGEFLVEGDEAMQRRPMKGLTDALTRLGAEFEFHKTPGCIPFTMRTHGIAGDAVTVDASESSQILSALLIMAAGAGRPFTVELAGETVSEPFVEMTLEMLRQFGAKVTTGKKNRFLVTGPAELPFGNSYAVEPDATAASYFLALPVAAGGKMTVEGLGNIRLQGDIRFAGVLRAAGLSVRGSLDLPDHPDEMRAERDGPATGVSADFEAFSDTFLTLAALAPLLSGKTRIEGIAHTRRQETDRVAAMAKELRKLGQKVEEGGDYLEIEPDLEALVNLAKKARAEGRLLEIDTYEDHRFAMSFAILGCRDLCEDGRPWLAIRNPACCGKTFPNFFEVLEGARAASCPFVTVAIDGGAATGKSSTAKGLAKKLRLMHVDTGSHYRALTHLFLQRSVSPDDLPGIEKTLAESPIGTVVEKDGFDAKIVVGGTVPAEADIRSDAVNASVSLYAAVPAVRAALREYQRSQREIARANGFSGLVMEGRDIGSVIFPDADLKVFLEADEATRALRRAGEGQSDSVAIRDKIDSTRKTAPLKCPDGAVRLDNSHMTLAEVIERIAALARKAVK